MLQDLIVELASFSSDPLGFAYYAFPWGEGELSKHDTLAPWQEELLIDLGRGIISIQEAIFTAQSVEPIQIARTSGHGIGKSALVAIIIWWAISTFEDTKGVITANTENQLKTKTWAEVAKWHRRFIGRELFKFTATSIFSVDPLHEKTWRIDMVPWSERNTEAFAGLHNEGKRILIIFDEASAIPDVIWEVTEGALTDENTQIIWLCFGNPTRNKGRFRECFAGGRFSHRWQYAAIDSREVRFTNKEQIARWIADYGEDSDFVRIRVRGIFPRVDASSFIPFDLARGALNREILPQTGCAIVLGVDVGRFGDDPSVIYPRQGRDAFSRPPLILQGLSTMELAAKVASEFLRLRAAICFVDSGGVGGGVVDRLEQLRIPVHSVDFGSGSKTLDAKGVKYANKRAEIWGLMRDWLATGSIPSLKTGEHCTLEDELIGPNYGLNNKEEILLEAKKDMRSRGVPSPNVADALACTFAFPSYEVLPGSPVPEETKPETEYDPLARERLSA
jgi:hypothetical protein